MGILWILLQTTEEKDFQQRSFLATSCLRYPSGLFRAIVKNARYIAVFSLWFSLSIAIRHPCYSNASNQGVTSDRFVGACRRRNDTHIQGGETLACSNRKNLPRQISSRWEARIWLDVHCLALP